MLYILMREDIPDMNAGKAIAQGCHAQSVASETLSADDSYNQWLSEGKDFGTTITLLGTAVNIENTVYEARLSFGDKYANTVTDETYPIKPVFGKPYTVKMLTCAYVFIPDISGLDSAIDRPSIKKLLRTNFVLFP